jgi:cold shock CspA family protein
MKSQGIAKAWLHDRRFGFIKPDAVGPDLFVHYSALLDCEALTPGVRVEFNVGTNPYNGKPCAENVSVLS